MKRHLQTFSMILPDGRAPIKELSTIDLNRIKRRTRQLFKKNAPAAVGLASVDVSLNIATAIGGSNHWQVHVHGIVANVMEREWKAVRGGLETDNAERRLFVEDATDAVGQLAYMAKPNFFRRVNYRSSRRKNTHIEPLSALQELELARWLSPYRAPTRFIKIGNIDDACQTL